LRSAARSSPPVRGLLRWRTGCRAHDLLTTVEHQVIDQASSLDESVERAGLSDLDWKPKVLALAPSGGF
jgi:hypothetical protein